jgi:methionine synthase II (cobalamin-independent)
MTKPSQTPPFRAEHVGSLLRPPELKAAFRDAAQGKIDGRKFAEIQDRCIREAVRMQEDVGLQSITDGEFRRGSWFYGFVHAVEGLTTKDAIFDFHDSDGGRATFQAPYVERKIKRTRGITTDEFAFVRAATTRTPKVTMPTPSCMHFFRGNDSVSRAAYRHLEDFWNDLFVVYREELAALAGLGCSYVQLDEVPIAMLCDPKIRAAVAAAGLDAEQLLETYISAINLCVAARPPGVTVGLHLCKLQGPLDGGRELRGCFGTAVRAYRCRRVLSRIRKRTRRRLRAAAPCAQEQESHSWADQQQAPGARAARCAATPCRSGSAIYCDRAARRQSAMRVCVERGGKSLEP